MKNIHPDEYDDLIDWFDSILVLRKGTEKLSCKSDLDGYYLGD